MVLHRSCRVRFRAAAVVGDQLDEHSLTLRSRPHVAIQKRLRSVSAALRLLLLPEKKENFCRHLVFSQKCPVPESNALLSHNVLVLCLFSGLAVS